MKTTTWIAFATVALSALLCGCSSGGDATSPEGSPASGTTAGGTLHVALAPSEDAEKMAAGFEPIRAELAKETGLAVDVVKVTDYASVVEAQRAGKVDLAWYGPLSMVLANEEAGAEPIVLGVQAGGDATYHSLIVVPANSPAKTIADLKGKKIALVDPGSCSGNLVPRSAVMKQTSQKAEDFFSQVTYAGSHDASLLSLVNGNVDACAVQDITYNAKTKSKEVDSAKYRILWTSDPLPQSPLAVKKGMDSGLKKRIINCFKSLAKNDVKMDVPGQGNYVNFVETSMETYKPIADMAKTLGLSKQDLGK